MRSIFRLHNNIALLLAYEQLIFSEIWKKRKIIYIENNLLNTWDVLRLFIFQKIFLSRICWYISLFSCFFLPLFKLRKYNEKRKRDALRMNIVQQQQAQIYIHTHIKKLSAFMNSIHRNLFIFIHKFCKEKIKLFINNLKEGFKNNFY